MLFSNTRWYTPQEVATSVLSEVVGTSQESAQFPEHALHTSKSTYNTQYSLLLSFTNRLHVTLCSLAVPSTACRILKQDTPTDIDIAMQNHKNVQYE